MRGGSIANPRNQKMGRPVVIRELLSLAMAVSNDAPPLCGRPVPQFYGSAPRNYGNYGTPYMLRA